ncbi:MAG TPA: PEP-CTERM sorting domain-containing protein [Gammaproteobacteria bacterium]|nr:PEP-CTERM sorting domain-containing protein [Gammaproteobacteria bacterium]
MFAKKVTGKMISMLFCFSLLPGAAQATLIVEDFGININGNGILNSDGVPFQAEVDLAAYNATTGLGSIAMTFSVVGSYAVDAFFDYEFSEGSNSYLNEYGSVSGSAASNQSWEIDEPGFVFGDIFDNWQFNDLDNSNAIPAGSEDDVAVALGWDFDLLVNETATLTFDITDFSPSSGFFLAHSDPDSNENVYFSSSLVITQAPTPTIPEPGTISLMLAGLFWFLFSGSAAFNHHGVSRGL